MFDAPKPDRHETYHGHPPLLESERFLRRPDRPDLDLPISVWRTGGLVAHEQEQPNEYNGDNGYRQCNGEPARPIEWGLHEPNGDKVLRGRNRRALTADVGGERNSELCMRHTCQRQSCVSGMGLRSSTARKRSSQVTFEG